MIRIAVGTGKHAKAFNIQQALLETVSEYFVKALRNKRLGAHPEPGVLRFPEHCVDAWEALCYWIFRHELPATAYEHHYILAVRCWCLGDKYAIDGFQDEALLILLREANSNNLKWEVIEEAVLNSRPGTQLRRLMAMEVKSQAIDFYSDEVDGRVLDALDGTGVMREVLEVHQACEKGEDRVENWFERDNQLWRTFMIGKGLGKHWVFRSGSADELTICV